MRKCGYGGSLVLLAMALLPAGLSGPTLAGRLLDGMLRSWGDEVPTDLDRLLHPDEAEAIEIY